MSGHGHVDPSNKKIALLISLLALVLAFSETLGKAAQTEALAQNIEASNLWNFFQAKTIRMTVLRTAGESLAAEVGPQAGDALKAQITKWKETAERYDSSVHRRGPQGTRRAREGRRASVTAPWRRTTSTRAASGAVQIAIVLASATIITGMNALAWVAGGLGLLGIVFSVIGFFAPTAVHLFRSAPRRSGAEVARAGNPPPARQRDRARRGAYAREHRGGGDHRRQRADQRRVARPVRVAGGEREHRVAVVHRVHRVDRARQPVVCHLRDLLRLRLGERGLSAATTPLWSPAPPASAPAARRAATRALSPPARRRPRRARRRERARHRVDDVADRVDRDDRAHGHAADTHRRRADAASNT